MGDPPDWYSPVRAARYARVAVWELLDHPEWIDVLLAAEAAEGKAREYHQSRG